MIVKEFEKFSQNIRIKSLEMVYKANASHIGGGFSMADILAVLYNGILNIYPQSPNNPQRDRFILSKGHTCAALYGTLALKGFFDETELDTYAQDGSVFLSHASHIVPGVEISAGSLGHGLPIACGLAIAAQKKKLSWLTYCLISDGELNEGSNWEAILLAPQLKLNNLILIVDYNKIQSLGYVKDIIDLEPIKDKFLACMWQVHEVDGHDHQELYNLFQKILANRGNSPHVIVAHTVKGKGVSFMEDKLLWHYKSPNKEQFEAALKELTL
jgi:transketolase